MASKDIQPLVITPAVIKGESIWGYLLRASDLNGYETPIEFLRYAGLTNSEARHIQVPIYRLQKLFLANTKGLSDVSYSLTEIEKYQRKKRIYNFMGYKIPAAYIHSTKMKICAECIKEKGYIDSFWDLNYTVGCDIHKRELIKKCPSCYRSISRYRKGMLVCVCGYDLSNEKGDVIESEELIIFLKIMRSKAQRVPVESVDVLRLGFPIEHLEEMDLHTLLKLIAGFSSNYGTATGEERDDRYDSTLRAAHIFSNWPNGFYGFMAGLGRGFTDRGYIHESYRQQFMGVNRTLKSQSLPRNEVKFIYDEFINYGLTHWKTAIVDKRMCRDFANERTIVGINGLAKRLRVQPSTARRMIEMGIIKVENHILSKNVKFLFDLSYQLPFKDGKGSSISARDSAKIIGLPVSVLSELRYEGVYTVNYIPAKLKSYHIMDLDRLKEKILFKIRKVPASYFNTKSHIFLKDVMRMKMGGASIKAKIISCIIERSIDVVGVVGESIPNIILRKNEVRSKVNDLKKTSLTSYLVVDTAKKLYCDPTAIPDLIAKSYLESKTFKNGIRISERSLKEFSKKYISCVEVSNLFEISLRKATSFAKSNSIPMLMIKRTHSKSLQPFIERKWLSKFLDNKHALTI